MPGRNTRSKSKTSEPSVVPVTGSVSAVRTAPTPNRGLGSTSEGGGPESEDQFGAKPNFAYGSPDRTFDNLLDRHDRDAPFVEILKKSIHKPTEKRLPTPDPVTGSVPYPALAWTEKPATIASSSQRNPARKTASSTRSAMSASESSSRSCEMVFETTSDTPLGSGFRTIEEEIDLRVETIDDAHLNQTNEGESTRTSTKHSSNTDCTEWEHSGHAGMEGYEQADWAFNQARYIGRDEQRWPPFDLLWWRNQTVRGVSLCLLILFLLVSTRWITHLGLLQAPGHGITGSRPGSLFSSLFKAPEVLFHDLSKQVLEVVQRVSGMQTQQADHGHRIAWLEDGVAEIEGHLRLHRASIDHLEDILPHQVVVFPRQDGKFDVDPTFWTALKEKLSEEGMDGAGRGLPANVQKHWQSQWEQFMLSNDARIEKQIESRLGRSRVEDHGSSSSGLILTKHEFINLLEAKYRELGREMSSLNDRLDDGIRRLHQTIEERIHRQIMQRYHSISREDVLERISRVQLEALSNMAMLSNIVQAANKINWAASSLDAIIDPTGSSYTYQDDSSSLSGRMGRWLLGLASHGAPRRAALDPWTELDQCWCTPMTTDARITIQLPRRIYPEEIGIEFAPAGSTPHARTAPRNMELWARIPDRDAWNTVRTDIEQSYGWTVEHDKSRRGWLPLARFFRYDIRTSTTTPDANHPSSPLQLFPLSVHLGQFVNASVDAVMLRILDNWGDDRRVCLYRLRLHGQPVQKDIPHPHPHYTSATATADDSHGDDDDDDGDATMHHRRYGGSSQDHITTTTPTTTPTFNTFASDRPLRKWFGWS